MLLGCGRILPFIYGGLDDIIQPASPTLRNGPITVAVTSDWFYEQIPGLLGISMEQFEQRLQDADIQNQLAKNHLIGGPSHAGNRFEVRYDSDWKAISIDGIEIYDHRYLQNGLWIGVIDGIVLKPEQQALFLEEDPQAGIRESGVVRYYNQLSQNPDRDMIQYFELMARTDPELMDIQMADIRALIVPKNYQRFANYLSRVGLTFEDFSHLPIRALKTFFRHTICVNSEVAFSPSGRQTNHFIDVDGREVFFEMIDTSQFFIWRGNTTHDMQILQIQRDGQNLLLHAKGYILTILCQHMGGITWDGLYPNIGANVNLETATYLQFVWQLTVLETLTKLTRSEDYRTLVDIDRNFKDWYDWIESGARSENPLGELYRFATLFQQSLRVALDNLAEIGYGCYNRVDPLDDDLHFYPEDVDPDDEFAEFVQFDQLIKLHNDVCWTRESFYELFTRSIDAGRQIEDYSDFYPPGSNVLWTEADLAEKVPLKRTDNYNAIWFYFNNYDRIKEALLVIDASAIPAEFLQTMRESAQLLASFGPYFEQRMREELPSVGKSWEEYVEFKREYDAASERLRQFFENGQVGVRPVRPQIDEEIANVRDEILKSEAIVRLTDEYEALSEEAKVQFQNVNQTFATDITQCRQGQLCNFITANSIIRTYNIIARSLRQPEIIRQDLNLEPTGVNE